MVLLLRMKAMVRRTESRQSTVGNGVIYMNRSLGASDSPHWSQKLWTEHKGMAKRTLLICAIGAGVILMAVQIFPRFFALFWYPDIKRILYEDFDFSDSWSSFWGVVGSFFYAAAWAPLLLWTVRNTFWSFSARNLVFGFIGTVVIYGHLPLAHALWGTDVCINQKTGEPVKWYFIDLGGKIVLRDSPGFEGTLGVQRRPATAQICRITQLQKQGIRPSVITDDPRKVKYFDDITGQARVWYYKSLDGNIDLFDAEGVHPATGEPLKRMTKEVAAEAQARILAAQAEAGRAREQAKEAAREQAEQAAKGAQEKARRELVDLFGVNSYPAGSAVFGVAPMKQESATHGVVPALISVLTAGLRSRALIPAEFVPTVYSSGQFQRMREGRVAVLSECGLAQRMRVALLIGGASDCRETGLSGVTSCLITIEMRIVRPSGESVLRQWSETGAGGSPTAATSRAIDQLIERNPHWLDEL
jgi:hypothetical protein